MQVPYIQFILLLFYEIIHVSGRVYIHICVCLHLINQQQQKSYINSESHKIYT